MSGRPEASRAWLEARTGWAGALGRVAAAPARRGWWLGAAIAVGFAVQLATGVLLLLYYVPHPDHAFASAQAILWDVPFGWLIRLGHAHGASVLLTLGIVHTLAAAIRADYKAPRELVWMCGRALLLLGLAAALSGYLLPWSQLSYWATTIATAPVEKMPLVGPALLRLARGGDVVGGATLSRAFVAHVAVLPLLALAGFAAYGALLRRAAARDPRGGRPAPAPQRAIEVALVAVTYLAALLALAAFAPELAFPLHAHLPADPLDTPDPIHPEWYFLWASELQRRIPDAIALLPFARGSLAPLAGWISELLPLVLIALGPLLLVAVPLLDRGPERDPRRRPVALSAIAATLLVLVLLTWSGVARGDAPPDGCVACHEQEEEETVSDPVPQWRRSVHAEAEVGCDGCHGGDPRTDDADEAHDEARGWVGTPGWKDMAGFCGACHEAVADAYQAGAFGAGLPGGVFPPSCATCHMATGHDTPHAATREILPDPLPERLRAAPVLAEAPAALWPTADRIARDAERIAALERRALPPTGLDVRLAAIERDFAPYLHRFDAAAWREGEARARTALAELEQRAGALEIEAGARARFAIAGLGALGAAALALAFARRAG